MRRHPSFYAITAKILFSIRVARQRGQVDPWSLVLRCIQMIHCGIALLVFPAKAGTHFRHGHRPSPV